MTREKAEPADCTGRGPGLTSLPIRIVRQSDRHKFQVGALENIFADIYRLRSDARFERPNLYFCDLHLPQFGGLLLIFPRNLSGLFVIELVIKGLGVVVVDQQKRLAFF
jgi:hypothetical protein